MSPDVTQLKQKTLTKSSIARFKNKMKIKEK